MRPASHCGGLLAGLFFLSLSGCHQAAPALPAKPFPEMVKEGLSDTWTVTKVAQDGPTLKMEATVTYANDEHAVSAIFDRKTKDYEIIAKCSDGTTSRLHGGRGRRGQFFDGGGPWTDLKHFLLDRVMELRGVMEEADSKS